MYILLLFLWCLRTIYADMPVPQDTPTSKHIRPKGTTLQTRIAPPAGFVRVPNDAASFGEYLQNLPLKPHGTYVYHYNGRVKPNNGVYAAVVDISVGEKDLQQCADAIMRLRAEYFYRHKKYDKINFHFTNGFLAEYSKWRGGYRIQINGNKTNWVLTGYNSNERDKFMNFMELVFIYAGTLSLQKEMKPIANISDLQIGDVWIQGGSPGHAVLVADVAKNPANGETLFLLIQSYMPAQDIQVLQNPNNSALSPWYNLQQIKEPLKTPEWTFTKKDLYRF